MVIKKRSSKFIHTKTLGTSHIFLPWRNSLMLELLSSSVFLC